MMGIDDPPSNRFGSKKQKASLPKAIRGATVVISEVMRRLLESEPGTGLPISDKNESVAVGPIIAHQFPNSTLSLPLRGTPNRTTGSVDQISPVRSTLPDQADIFFATLSRPYALLPTNLLEHRTPWINVIPASPLILSPSYTEPDLTPKHTVPTDVRVLRHQ